MQISEIQKKIEKIFLVLEIIAFELVVLETHFSRDRILVIWNQYVNKQSQDFTYLKDKIFRTEDLSE